ncbi:DNA/RNA non-specific endonuclease [Aquabacterium sp. CECT 9606]|uniref:DNA/RNA non-specific endonuclease n=1 Tax=Aquabacterium sp. CECT 9606 TaxID=2845822 RepID=UPI001E51DF8C|nr:DNA/RNA non-specific endonuclease [Aquabacterium sp. CECT 9606]CAH0353117.1 hypothetical protein AQB9606_03070 [Aquabacterium sp. CECT 9606]
MLTILRAACLVLLALAIFAVAAWLHFLGTGWWSAAIGAILGYAALLSGFYLGKGDAWHQQSFRLVHDFALATERRATESLAVLAFVVVGLGYGAYGARPAPTNYFEVRVYDRVDLPGKHLVGTAILVHTRTDGLTHREVVGDDGGAVFRSVTAPTTLVYQVDIASATPPFVTGGNYTLDRLPAQLAIDVAQIPAERRIALSRGGGSVPITQIQSSYLAGVDERGDRSLQAANAPWGVPEAAIVVNRFSYVLGFDPVKRLPRWVAYSIGSTQSRVLRDKQFIRDPAIAPDVQARPSDYTRTGYDRGHLISPADLFFKGPVAVAEAFYMSTVAPQTPWLNRTAWATLEQRVRSQVLARGERAFVIAGPLYLSDAGSPGLPNTINNGIPVPSHFFRIVAVARGHESPDVFAVILPNLENGQASIQLDDYAVSISNLEVQSGLTFFPLLEPAVARRIKDRVVVPWR